MISVSGKKWEQKKTSKNSIEKLKQDHKFSEIISKFFGRPLAAGGIKSKIGIEWFPEKKIGNISIKFPDGADIVLKNYPFSAESMCEEFMECFNNIKANKERNDTEVIKILSNLFIFKNKVQKLLTTISIKQYLKMVLKKL